MGEQVSLPISRAPGDREPPQEIRKDLCKCGDAERTEGVVNCKTDTKSAEQQRRQPL